MGRMIDESSKNVRLTLLDVSDIKLPFLLKFGKTYYETFGFKYDKCVIPKYMRTLKDKIVPPKLFAKFSVEQRESLTVKEFIEYVEKTEKRYFSHSEASEFLRCLHVSQSDIHSLSWNTSMTRKRLNKE